MTIALLMLGAFFIGVGCGAVVMFAMWRHAREVAGKRFTDDFMAAMRDGLDDPA